MKNLNEALLPKELVDMLKENLVPVKIMEGEFVYHITAPAPKYRQERVIYSNKRRKILMPSE